MISGELQTVELKILFEVLGDLIRKYGKDITPKKRGRDKEKYRIRVLERSFLSEVPLKALRAHHITKFREDRLKEVSAWNRYRRILIQFKRNSRTTTTMTAALKSEIALISSTNKTMTG